VLLKREPLDPLWEEFLIPRRKFVPVRKWGRKAVNEINLSICHFVFSADEKLHNEVGLDGNVYGSH